MSGKRPSTPTKTIGIHIHVCIVPSRLGQRVPDERHDTAVPLWIHFLDQEPIARPHGLPPVLRTQASQHLHDLPIELDRDETLPVAIERHHRSHFLLYGALECESRFGSE